VASLEEEVRAVVGPTNVFTGDAIESRYTTDILNKYHSHPVCVARPGNTGEVAEIVKIAARHRVPIVPLGGRTGVVGGGMTEGGVILSLERMNRVLEIDGDAMTMTVEAGAPLQAVQDAAEAEGFMIPLDLGARGSCTIGGSIATTAGGNRVLRWGMARDMVLGLEAVLADGSVVSSLGKFIKDNAGYRWKDLLCGSEGTLGVVTRAVLRMRPQPKSVQTAIVAMSGFDKAPRLLRRLEARFGGQLSSFELMWGEFYDYVSTAQEKLFGRPPPVKTGYPLYAVVESMGAHAERDGEAFEDGLAEAQEEGLIEDAVIARSERERKNLWSVRDELAEPFKPLFPAIAFDVSLALKDMPAFVDQSRRDLTAAFPSTKTFFYGHAGDGNLHLIATLPPNDEETELAIERIVYGVVRNFRGSVSAEHGIGLMKREFIEHTRSPEELALMRSIKRALDPLNILNPGKILPEEV
jgi:FAD/FMN-containing dehydrogenase